MKTKYKYIHFVEAEGENKTVSGKTAYECKNNKTKTTLAIIFWYQPWKEYCFTQADSNVIFNDGCLIDTIDFIRQLKATEQA